MEDVQDKKNIACTRSFEKMHNDMFNLSERVSTFAANLGEKLRKQNSHCNMISVFLMSNHFRQDLQQHRVFINIKTEFPTNSTLELNKLAQMALKSIYKEGIYYKKAGVIVSALTPADNQQLKFFGGESGKHIALMKAIDKTNKKVGVKLNLVRTIWEENGRCDKKNYHLATQQDSMTY